MNLRKLSFVAREIRAYAKKHNLKPSWTDYRRWKSKPGKDAPNIRLRFSKSGDEGIERQYATHYVGAQKISEAKARREARQDKAIHDVTEE